MAIYQLVEQTYADGTDRKFPVDRLIGYQFDGSEIISTDEDLDDLVGTGIGNLRTLTPAQATTQGGVDLTVTPVGDAAAADESTILTIAEDAAVAITFDVGSIVLVSSTTGDKAMTVASANPGQQISINVKAVTGGSYTLAAVNGSVLTFNATAEAARIVRNTADDGWDVLVLSGATLV